MESTQQSNFIPIEFSFLPDNELILLQLLILLSFYIILYHSISSHVPKESVHMTHPRNTVINKKEQQRGNASDSHVNH